MAIGREKAPEFGARWVHCRQGRLARGQEKARQGAGRVRVVHRNDQFSANSSTSNFKVALGGITPPAPRAP